ncbi:unnamed protein product [Phytomonas sp. EM1]|nr:unnamed protein product [Phytomonas sp. EM1]|eukprot:CCW63090.1 unnamed protein product [Phytomonas sp. isolate EM1]
MSLFDLDDNDFTSETSSSSGSTHSGSHPIVGGDSSKKPLESKLPFPAPPVRSNELPGSMSDAPRGRFALTESEIRSAQQDRKKLLERRLASKIGFSGGWNAASNLLIDNPTGSVPVAGDGKAGRGDSSVFGNSIAAALRLRKEEQEELLLRKLRAERSNDPALIEKDLEVGVFVTPAYKQMLRRHHKRQSGQTDGTENAPDELVDSKKRGESHDDNDPLEAYIRSLERNQQRGLATSAGDPPSGLSSSHSNDVNSSVSETKATDPGGHHDQVMLMRLYENAQPSERGRQQQRGPLPEDGISPPSFSELEALVLTEGTPTHAEERGAENAKGRPISDALKEVAPGSEGNPNHLSNPGSGVASQNEALIAHQRTLFLSREARKRRRADGDFIDACARRCEERMLKALGVR